MKSTSSTFTFACAFPVAAAALCLAFTELPASGQVDLETGLEAYYTFDEGSGDVAGDLSGQFRSARVHDHPQFEGKEILWTEGRFGRGVDVDGTYFLAVPEYFGIAGQGARTISMWVNTPVVPNTVTVLAGWGPNLNQQRWHFKFQGTTGALRTENQGGNNFGALSAADGAWHHVVSVFPEGGTTIGDVDHYVDGVLDTSKGGGLTNPVNTTADPLVPVTFGGSPFDGGFRFATVNIDDVRIYSRALTAAEIEALAQGQGVVSGAPPLILPMAGLDRNYFADAAAGLVFNVAGVGGVTVDSAAITVSLNGADVTTALAFTGDSTAWTVRYDGLEVNEDYSVEITAVDANGLRARRVLSFSTYAEDNFVIEAEDYNFQGGQYINDPVPCVVLGGTDGCYFDRVSLPGIDSFDMNGFSDDDTVNVDSIYRYGNSAAREEEFDTFVSGDSTRSKYLAAGVDEYDVNRLAAGDWANYTRDFPAAEGFRILLRARASAAQTVLLERVTTDPAAANQEVTLLGAFHVPASASYTFVALSDLAGEKPLSARLSGQQTLRLTAAGANNNLNLNYLLFVPAANATVLPSITLTAPSAGSVHPSGASIEIEAAASDEDGFISHVAFFAHRGYAVIELGTDTEAPFRVSWENVPAGVYLLGAAATDNDGLFSVSALVQIIVDSDPPEVASVRGSPSGDAVEIIFNEPVETTSAETIAHYSLDPPLAILSAIHDGQRVILSTEAQSEGAIYTLAVRGVADVNGIVQPEATASFTAVESGLLFGLELYWPFDDAAGDVARDLSGFGRHAAIFDHQAMVGRSIRWDEGRFQGAVDFDGLYFLAAPDYYGIAGAAPRTISLWINTSWVVPSGNTALMGWGRAATSQRWHFKLESSINGALRVENDGGNVFADVPVNDGTWHHVAAVFPEGGSVIGDVIFYIDGVVDPGKNGSTANPVDTSTDPAVARPVTIGGAPLNTALRFSVAMMDDVRLYSRALGEAEIGALAQGKGILSGTPVAQGPIAIQRTSDGTVSVSWTGQGTLQTTTALGAAWLDVEIAASPYIVAPGETAFYRVRFP